MSAPWTRKEFEDNLRKKGKGYHIYHPFHVMMYEGKLSKEQLQSWVMNRFYYQISIPLKDAAILSNCEASRMASHAGEKTLIFSERAIPTSLCAKAPASFNPSPIMATF